jgi:hypothetical protein
MSSSPDLYASLVVLLGMFWIQPSNIVHDPVYKIIIVWEDSRSEFVLNRMIELVNNGVTCHNGFREKPDAEDCK